MKAEWIISGIIALMVAFLVGVYVVSSYFYAKLLVTPIMSTYLPIFKVGQCYMSTGLHESWEPNPEGIVIKVGVQNYLVMNAIEANRLSGGTKIATKANAVDFDLTHYQVACPSTWKEHSHLVK